MQSQRARALLASAETAAVLTPRAAPGPLSGAISLAMAWWRPILTAVCLCVMILITRPSSMLDRRLSDSMLAGQQLPADKRVLLVVIDAGDIRKYGGPPLRRDAMADLLERFDRGKARRVLLDANLSEPLNEAEDARLARAIRQLGANRIALASGTGPNDRPLAAFAASATVVDSRLTADQDGWHRNIGIDLGNAGANPAIWLAQGKLSATPVPLDLRIAPWKYQRASVRDVLDGRVKLQGRLIVVSSSVKIAPSRAYLPLTGYADRAAVLAMGTQSVREGHSERSSTGSELATLVEILAVLAAFGWTARARSGRKLAYGLGAIALWSITGLIVVSRIWAVSVSPVAMLSCIAAIVNVTMIFRFNIPQMMSSFLKGDVSPEEAWAWRGTESFESPTLLFGTDGRIKRSNAAAAALVTDHASNLAIQCMPSLGERADRIELTADTGVTCSYRVDWPYSHVPIAVLHDVSEVEAMQKTLHRQLNTDDLTGIANRRGFDAALNKASLPGEAYALFFIDMNGFKAVNDTHGHDAGDEVLVLTAERLRRLMRREDTIARLGGDEFAIIVRSNLDELSAERVVASITEAFEEPMWLTSVETSVNVGAAVGFAVSGRPGDDAQQVMRRADQAMYARKRQQKRLLAA